MRSQERRTLLRVSSTFSVCPNRWASLLRGFTHEFVASSGSAATVGSDDPQALQGEGVYDAAVAQDIGRRRTGRAPANRKRGRGLVVEPPAK